MGNKKQCLNQNCTIGVTGTCLLLNPDPSKCENYIPDVSGEFDEGEGFLSSTLGEAPPVDVNAPARRQAHSVNLLIVNYIEAPCAVRIGSVKDIEVRRVSCQPATPRSVNVAVRRM